MLDIEERSGVTVVRLRHGKVNALDLDLLQAITAAMHEIDEERALVLTGTDTAFSAGVDLRRILDGGTAYVEQFLPALSETFLAIFDRPGPVVAAANGHAIAGGCVMAAACDLRVMSQGTIGLAELSVGVPFPTSALEIIRHAVGPVASQLVLTAALLDPPQARSIGLIDHIELPAALLDSAVGHAQRMARIPAEVFAFSKRQLQQPARDRIAARSEDDQAVLAMWSSTDTQQAISGYLGALERSRSAR
ncbi:enoyl-CoA hydratase/isomerase family protein [Saccharopolyspora spinosa]|uniref:Enoyl-CoA hydratase n=1 Tax=Saccharopolyspora spinosa TaxID=60894 RepID=A0A2N3Y0E4_SACSN|nr:enoyl-CoA hydratase/isomerase family protein [Saccharopolyspora spinosa]PKW16392.1 enoyl-CoA hydratase [Saccharopolyspora spinosa]